MIIGQDSIKKFGILFVLVLAGVVDFIAAMNNAVVAKINGAVVSLALVGLAVYLYVKWSKESEEKYKK